MQSASFYEENMLSRPAIRNCSFEELQTAKLSEHLYRIKPGTRMACMRDCLMSSLGYLNKLHKVLKMAGTTNRWRFFTLVFCFSEDKISNTTKKDLFSYTVELNYEWTVEQNKIVFIPI
jgi:hypothetical protein